MRIAITSTDGTLDGPVDPRFGRAPYVLVVDTDTDALETIDNGANREATQGAGVNAAQAVIDHHVGWLLTGAIGPKAFAALNAANIRVAAGQTGTCREALRRFKDQPPKAVSADQATGPR